MHDTTFEVFNAREVRCVAASIIEIAAAHEKEVAGVLHELFFRAALHVNSPPCLPTVPARTLNVLAVANFLVDAVIFCGVFEVF